MGLQIFGTKKCPVTRKAERFFKERDIDYQFIDLSDKGISPGELASVAAALGGEALIDLEGARARKRGLAYMDFDVQEEILADPLLLRTPVIRNGREAAIGDDAAAWEAFAKKLK
jgi:arsenate reductase-like glutaredoxin family protein